MIPIGGRDSIYLSRLNALVTLDDNQFGWHNDGGNDGSNDNDDDIKDNDNKVNDVN